MYKWKKADKSILLMIFLIHTYKHFHLYVIKIYYFKTSMLTTLKSVHVAGQRLQLHCSTLEESEDLSTSEISPSMIWYTINLNDHRTWTNLTLISNKMHFKASRSCKQRCKTTFDSCKKFVLVKNTIFDTKNFHHLPFFIENICFFNPFDK